MQNEMTKAIIVDDDQNNYDLLRGSFANWDTQHFVPTLQSLWNGLDSGTLSTDSEIIILSDRLYEQDEDLFVSTLATMAPHALVITVFWNPENIGPIEEDLNIFLNESQLPKAAIYRVRPEVAISQIEESILAYNTKASNPVL